MLENSDTATVKAWLKAALEKSGKKPAELAEHCGVRPQAVNGWLRTGRITKTNLARAAAFLGEQPTFVHAATALHANEPVSLYGWPFATVTQGELLRLAPKRLERLDTLLRQRLDEWAEDDNGGSLANPAGR